MANINNPGLKFLQESIRPERSPLRVCFTSRSSAGAWQIRGEQIAAMKSNWEAINRPTDEELKKFDLFCIVKKPDYDLIERIKKLNKPIIYDIVDSWAQPEDGLKFTDLKRAKELFKSSWNNIQADGYIFPTRRMQLDLGALVVNSTTIYHHFWPQIQHNPIRETVQIIGYEGANYLGKWQSLIEEQCHKRNIKFIANPTDYKDIDIVVLVREGIHGSFLAKHYKSNVKLANAYGSGTPALVHIDEMSAHDTDTGDVCFFSDQPESFERQLDRLIENCSLRKDIHYNFLLASKSFEIKNIASQFETFFQSIASLAKRKFEND